MFEYIFSSMDSNTLVYIINVYLKLHWAEIELVKIHFYEDKWEEIIYRTRISLEKIIDMSANVMFQVAKRSKYLAEDIFCILLINRTRVFSL